LFTVVDICFVVLQEADCAEGVEASKTCAANLGATQVSRPQQQPLPLQQQQQQRASVTAVYVVPQQMTASLLHLVTAQPPDNSQAFPTPFAIL
jgi:hypothetical protein